MKRTLKITWVASVLSSMAASGPAAQAGPLDFIKDQANAVIKQAEQSGDFLIWRAAQEARTLIDSWEKTNTRLMDKAFNDLDKATQDLFNGVEASLKQFDKTRELAAADAERLTVQWAQIVKSIPSTGDAELFSYSPRVILPDGPNAIIAKLIGPRLAQADGKLSGPDGTPIALRGTSDTELLAQMARQSLTFDEKEGKFATYRFDFITEDNNLLPDKRSQRDLVVFLAPKRLGSYEITWTKPHSTREKDLYDAGGIRFQGKDREEERGVALSPDKKQQGWKIDTDRVRNEWDNKWVVQGRGESGTCNRSPKLTKLSEDVIVFTAAIGSVRTLLENKDGWVDCAVKVPIYRIVPADPQPGEPFRGDLDWLQEKKVNLPNDVASKQINVTLFNGKTHIIDESRRNPLGILNVEDNGNSVIFRPNPPTDF